MKKPWKKHGESSMGSLENHGEWSQNKIPWFSWGNSMLSMLTWNRKIVKIFPMKAWKAWNLKPWESMGSIVFSSILLLIISRKHGKKAWESMGFMQVNLHPSGSLVAAALAFLASTSTLVTWLAPSCWKAVPPYCQHPVALPS